MYEPTALKNVSTKSVILAPFNTTRSNLRECSQESIRDLIKDYDKLIVGEKVLEIDRQYELNNNCELDNGVYNKFIA